ncbi:MAG: hypothetical protein E7294_08950 [Lachnospiraceae bacterium]|nr:hypothetical protein [Lachnospiraceae bacterium]
MEMIFAETVNPIEEMTNYETKKKKNTKMYNGFRSDSGGGAGKGAVAVYGGGCGSLINNGRLQTLVEQGEKVKIKKHTRRKKKWVYLTCQAEVIWAMRV